MAKEAVRNDSVSVGTTAVEILRPANLNNPREAFAIRNNSTGAQKITLVFGDAQAIASGTGVVLDVGQPYSESNSEGFETWQGRVWAIADLASGTLGLMER